MESKGRIKESYVIATIYKLKLPIFLGDKMNEELTITIVTEDVLVQLKENRKRFVNSFKALLKAYKKKVEAYQKKYAEYTKKATSGAKGAKDVEPVPPQEPEDRTKDYDFYIELLELHTEDTVKLSEPMFRRLWKDQWEWMHRHINTLEAYNADADVATALRMYNP